MRDWRLEIGTALRCETTPWCWLNGFANCYRDWGLGIGDKASYSILNAQFFMLNSQSVIGNPDIWYHGAYMAF
jgi:hypothetical protein